MTIRAYVGLTDDQRLLYDSLTQRCTANDTGQEQQPGAGLTEDEYETLKRMALCVHYERKRLNNNAARRRQLEAAKRGEEPKTFGMLLQDFLSGCERKEGKGETRAEFIADEMRRPVADLIEQYGWLVGLPFPKRAAAAGRGFDLSSTFALPLWALREKYNCLRDENFVELLTGELTMAQANVLLKHRKYNVSPKGRTRNKVQKADEYGLTKEQKAKLNILRRGLRKSLEIHERNTLVLNKPLSAIEASERWVKIRREAIEQARVSYGLPAVPPEEAEAA